jgi:GNAT superfamily N-acetyltransferase
MKDLTSLKTIKRSLALEEADLIFHLIKTDPNITGYTVKELSHFKHTWIAEVNKKFAGFVVNKDFGQNWTECAAIYVLEEYRGIGIGRKLFETSIHDAKDREKNFFTATRNPKIIKIIHEQNMIIKTHLISLPFPIAKRNIRFILNFYRIKETIRKAIKYKNANFIFAFKRKA